MSMLMVCCHCLFTFSKKYISRPVIKFPEITYGREKAAYGFWADWIGTRHGLHKAPLDLNWDKL